MKNSRDGEHHWAGGVCFWQREAATFARNGSGDNAA